MTGQNTHCPVIATLVQKLLEESNGDPVVATLAKRFVDRSQVGIAKYGTTLAREDLSTADWINHATEEALDLSAYLEVLILKKPMFALLDMQKQALAIAADLQSLLQNPAHECPKSDA